MSDRNPYAISFGRIPNQFIGRDLLIDEIVETLNSDLTGENTDGPTFFLRAEKYEMTPLSLKIIQADYTEMSTIM